MRIITGKYKGRTIEMPKGIRPTQNKARKAIFDILGNINGLFFLELFAGSGAVGLEALSQGAREVVFVEKDRTCVKLIQKNFNGLKSQASSFGNAYGHATCESWRPAAIILNKDVQDAIKVLHRDKKEFNIIFADPPYYQDLAKKTLQTILSYDILAPNGFIVMQHFKKDNLPAQMGDLNLFKQAKYGDTILSFYKKSGE